MSLASSSGRSKGLDSDKLRGTLCFGMYQAVTRVTEPDHVEFASMPTVMMRVWLAVCSTARALRRTNKLPAANGHIDRLNGNMALFVVLSLGLSQIRRLNLRAASLVFLTLAFQQALSVQNSPSASLFAQSVSIGDFVTARIGEKFGGMKTPAALASYLSAVFM